MNSESIATESPFDLETRWDALGLDGSMLAAVEARGYTHPTTVQVRALPKALAGQDLVVRSKTGSGKTAAFGIPLLCRVDTRPAAAIVLTPTRELAIQVATEIDALSAGRGLRVVTLYGGVPIGEQTQALHDGASVVVGTPGRVRDHIRRGNLDLSKAQVGVLDEADEMLSMGFVEDVTAILDLLPKSVQFLLFSATVDEGVRGIIGRYLKSPEEIFVSLDGQQAADTVEHVLYETVLDYPKPRQLLVLLEIEDPDSAIVFCNTRDDTDVVARFLSRQGYVAEALSSNLQQRARETVMAKMKRREIDVLVATDVAARGIDISDLSHVFNYSLPEDPAVYLHRTGRTGRIGKKGRAVSLMSGKELGTRKILESKYGVRFENRVLPSQKDAERLWTERHVGQLQHAAHDGQPFEGFLPLARRLRDMGNEGDALVARALRSFYRLQRMEEAAKQEGDGDGPILVPPEEPAPRVRHDGPPRGGGGGHRGGRRGGSRRR